MANLARQDENVAPDESTQPQVGNTIANLNSAYFAFHPGQIGPGGTGGPTAPGSSADIRALPPTTDFSLQSPGDVVQRMHYLANTSNWLPDEAKVQFATSGLDYQQISDAVGAMKPLWNGVTYLFHDPTVLEKKPGAMMAWKQYLDKNLGPWPVADEHLDSIQKSLQQKGYGRQLDPNAVWTPQWNDAFHQWINDTKVEALGGHQPGSSPFGTALGALQDFAGIPAHIANALIGVAVSLPSEMRKFAATMAGGIVGGLALPVTAPLAAATGSIGREGQAYKLRDPYGNEVTLAPGESLSSRGIHYTDAQGNPADFTAPANNPIGSVPAAVSGFIRGKTPEQEAASRKKEGIVGGTIEAVQTFLTVESLTALASKAILSRVGDSLLLHSAATSPEVAASAGVKAGVEATTTAGEAQSGQGVISRFFHPPVGLRRPGTIAEFLSGSPVTEEGATQASRLATPVRAAVGRGLVGAAGGAYTAEQLHKNPLLGAAIGGAVGVASVPAEQALLTNVARNIPWLGQVGPWVAKLSDADGLYYRSRSMLASPYQFAPVAAAGNVLATAGKYAGFAHLGAAAQQATGGTDLSRAINQNYLKPYDDAMTRWEQVIPSWLPFHNGLDDAAWVMHPSGGHAYSTMGDTMEAVQNGAAGLIGARSDAGRQVAKAFGNDLKDSLKPLIRAHGGEPAYLRHWTPKVWGYAALHAGEKVVNETMPELTHNSPEWRDAVHLEANKAWDDPRTLSHALAEMTAGNSDELSNRIIRENTTNNIHSYKEYANTAKEYDAASQSARLLAQHQDALLGEHNFNVGRTPDEVRPYQQLGMMNLNGLSSQDVNNLAEHYTAELDRAGNDVNAQNQVAKQMTFDMAKHLGINANQMAEDLRGRVDQIRAAAKDHASDVFLHPAGRAVAPEDSLDSALRLSIPRLDDPAKTGIEVTRTAEGHAHLVMRDNEGRALGKLDVTPGPEGSSIPDIAVLPDARRQGVATQLMNRAQQEGFNVHAGLEHSGKTEQGEAFARSITQPNVREGLLNAAYTPELQQAVADMRSHGYRPVIGNGIGWHYLPYAPIDSLNEGMKARERVIRMIGLNPVNVPSTDHTFRDDARIRNAVQDAVDNKKLDPWLPGWNTDMVMSLLREKRMAVNPPPILAGVSRAMDTLARLRPAYRAKYQEVLDGVRSEFPKAKSADLEAMARSRVSTGNLNGALSWVDMSKNDMVDELTHERELPPATIQSILADDPTAALAQPLMSRDNAIKLRQVMLNAWGKAPAGDIGASKIERFLRTKPMWLGTTPMPGGEFIGDLPNNLVRLRNQYRFGLSPFFDIRRVIKTNVKGALEGAPVSFTPRGDLQAQGRWDEGLDALHESGWDDHARMLDSGDQAAQVLNQNSAFHLFDHQAYEARLALWGKDQGMSGDEINKLLVKTMGYGGRGGEGRTALERTANFFFFPFSFDKTLYRNFGGYMLDHPAQLMMLNKGLRAFDQFNKDHLQDKGWEGWLSSKGLGDHIPIFKEALRFNAFAHGIGVGEFGGLNAPFLNPFLPQVYPYSTKNPSKWQDFIKSVVPAYKDLARVVGETKDQWSVFQSPTTEGQYAQKFDAYKARDALRLQYANALDANRKVQSQQTRSGVSDPKAFWTFGADDLKDYPQTKLVRALLGQPISADNFQKLLHEKYPAYDPNASAQFGQKAKDEMSVWMLEHPEDADNFKYLNAWASAIDQHTWDPKKTVNFDMARENFDRMRHWAVQRAESSPRFYDFYNRWLARDLGPIERV